MILLPKSLEAATSERSHRANYFQSHLPNLLAESFQGSRVRNHPVIWRQCEQDIHGLYL